MYVIERNKKSAWLCDTARSTYDVHAVQLRLQGDMKDFDKFKKSIDNFERIDAGVIQLYKCSEVSNCKECPRCLGCDILKRVQETAQAHSEWTKWVEDNGGHTF